MAERPEPAVEVLEYELRQVIARLGSAENEANNMRQQVELLMARRDSIRHAIARLTDG